MLFSKEEALDQREARSKAWRRTFAFLPIRVGTTSFLHGRYAWLRFVEQRKPDPFLAPSVMEYRLPGSKESYRCFENLRGRQ